MCKTACPSPSDASGNERVHKRNLLTLFWRQKSVPICLPSVLPLAANVHCLTSGTVLVAGSLTLRRMIYALHANAIFGCPWIPADTGSCRTAWVHQAEPQPLLLRDLRALEAKLGNESFLKVEREEVQD